MASPRRGVSRRDEGTRVELGEREGGRERKEERQRGIRTSGKGLYNLGYVMRQQSSPPFDDIRSAVDGSLFVASSSFFLFSRRLIISLANRSRNCRPSPSHRPPSPPLLSLAVQACAHCLGNDFHLHSDVLGEHRGHRGAVFEMPFPSSLRYLPPRGGESE